MADYSINAVTRKVSYTGSAGVGPYAFGFEVLTETDLAVYFNSTLLSISTNYSVSVASNGTGTVTLSVAGGGNIPTTPDADDTIVIIGARDIERTTDFVTGGDLRASSLNQGLDSLTIFDQQIDERVDRSIKAPAYDPTGINMTLPAKASRASKFLSFAANGDVTTSDLSGLSELIVDNIKIDGNTISSISGNITIDPYSTERTIINHATLQNGTVISGTFTNTAGETTAQLGGSSTQSIYYNGTVVLNTEEHGLRLFSNASASEGATLNLDSNIASGSVANNDVIGKINFSGHRTNNADFDWARIKTILADKTLGSEKSRLEFAITNDGDLDTVMLFSSDSSDNAYVQLVGASSSIVITPETGTIQGLQTGIIIPNTLRLTSTSALSAASPYLYLIRDSASPAPGDKIGTIIFQGEDDGSNVTTYAQISTDIDDETGGTEDGSLRFEVMQGGTLSTEMEINALGVTVTDNLIVDGDIEFDGLSGTGSVSVTDILDEDNMASNSATVLATQQSIKAYVDSQVGTADTLSEVLALGNTTGGTDIVVSVDDVISMDNGTNSLPSLTTTGDLNTGLYFPAADQVGLTVGGTQRLNVSATGIDVTGTVTSDGMTVEGDVFIGYTANVAGAPLQVNTAGTTTLGLSAWQNPSHLAFRRSNNATIGGNTTVADDDVIGKISFLGADGSNYEDAAFIQVAVDGTLGTDTTDMPARIEFATSADNSDSPTTRMTIESSGRVIFGDPDGDISGLVFTGLATTDPVINTNATGAEFVAYRTDNAVNDGDFIGAYLFGNDDNDATEDHFAGMWAKATGTAGSMDLHFAAGKAGYEADSAQMTFSSAGNLGIGTTAPALDLHVVGADGVGEGVPSFNADSVAVFQNSGSAGDAAIVHIISGTTGNAFIAFGDKDDSIRQTITANQSDGDLKFATGNAALAMTIDSSGNVGIPTGDLTIGSGQADAVILELSNTDSVSNGLQIQLSGNGKDVYFWNHENAATAFATNNIQRMTLDADGNLSLGTTAPMQDFGDGRTTLALKGTGSTDYATIQMGNYGTSGNDQLHGQIAFYDVHSGSDLRVSAISSYREITTNSSYLSFATSPGSAGLTEAMRIDRAGRLLVGTDSASFNSTAEGKFWAYGEAANSGFAAQGGAAVAGYFNRSSTAGDIVEFRFNNNDVGSITVSSSATSYNTSSDYRLKENVVGLTGATDRVKALKPSRFNFISEPDATVDGFLAHEAQAVVPEAVHGTKDAMIDEEYEVTPAVYEDVITPAVEAVEAVLDEDGVVITEAVEAVAATTESVLVTEAVMGTRSVPDMQGIDQSKLVPLLTAALQEALTRIETLEAAVTALQGD